ncbi:MAG: putative ABC exporter domain-containing protein [Eubacteriales bacterium]
MSTFALLLRTDLLKIKNYLRDIIRSPVKLIIYIVYIVWMVSIIFQVANGVGKPTNVSNIELKKDIISIIINILVFVAFGFTIYSGSKEISGLFSMGDVNYLFSSPISSKKILAYAMIKVSFKTGLASIFLIFMLPMLQMILGSLDPWLLIYSFIGVMSLTIFTVPFSFLSFILASRFGLKKWLFLFLYGIAFIIVAAIGYGIYIHQDIMQGAVWVFEQPLYHYIPIIGWSAHLIGVGFLGETTMSIIFLGLQVFTIGIISFFAIYLAEDYYEDALPSAEKVASIKRQVKEKGNAFDIVANNPKKKVHKVHVPKVRKGPWAFLWMQFVTKKRGRGAFLFQWKNAVLLLISIAFGLFLPYKTIDTYYIAAGVIAYAIFIFSTMISIDSELGKKYIFILPGQPWKKILALNTIPIIRTSILIGCILVPIAILFKVHIMASIAGLLFPISMVILNLFTTVIIHILIPSKFDQKAFYPLIRIFSFIVFLIPPIVVGTIIIVATMNIDLALYSVIFINLIMSVLCLFIADWLFGRLEMR